MNLYLFNDSDSAAVYGIGTYLKELTLALEGSAINIHVVHLRSVRPKFEIVKTNDIESWYIPEVRYENTFSGSIQKVEDYYRNVICLLQLHIKDTTDLVFHINFNQCLALVNGLKKTFDCKTVAIVHYLKWSLELKGNLHKLHDLKSKSESQRTSFEKLLYKTDKYESLLFMKADKVVVLSHHMQCFLETEYQLNSNKISIIPNGLFDLTENTTNSTCLRKKWNIQAREKLILFAGRLDEVKGLGYLIKAFRKVLEKLPNCRLMIAGNGNYNVYIREAKDACTKITFTGLLEKTELYELYQIADVGVVPSLYEPFGYVAVEMMMHKLPIVATATSGLNEIVDDSCGLKVPITVLPKSVEIDTALLAEKILYLLQYPAEAKKMGQNGRKRYLREYSMEVFRKNMLNFYSSLFN